ncbi:MAG: DUF4157 domain-containing protein [Chitinophagaceae bacterium]|nr:DUF4157 domain-containing protein [Chitinophagaceae bacterium]MCW5929694.1 DUF4157 domain-containing protein [Chitinophagaceae bacterium]
MAGIQIKERSFKARVAAFCLGVNNVAFTLGKTIYLYNATRQEFLMDERWVKHELKHVEQFRQHGFWGFVIKYSVETLRRGYRNNKYEIEARDAEKLPGYTIAKAAPTRHAN